MTAPAHLFKTARRQLRKIRHRGAKTDTERRLVASADQQREQGLGWRYDGFATFADAKLFETLASFGIQHDEASFRREALEVGSPTRQWERWAPQSTAEGKWRDLPMLAARELWRRLLPDQNAPEVVADEIDELLELAEVTEDPATHWLKAARRLIAGCTVEGRLERSRFTLVSRESGSDLMGWMVEMPAALVGTPAGPEAPELCESFASLIDAKSILAERAEILARLGQREAAVEQIEALLAKHPDDPVVLLKAGGTYEALGIFDKAQLYLRLYTTVMQSPGAAEKIAAASKAKVALKPVPRVDPNDRCPCGSGKKYKRCHGLAS